MRARILDVRRGLTSIEVSLAPEQTETSNKAISDLEKLKGKVTVIEFKTREKRSKSANSYLWVLCDLIAQKVRGAKEDVYRILIRNEGVWTDIRLLNGAVRRTAECWQRNGVGWISEVVGSDDSMTDLRLYYGSSTYNTQEMSRLINAAVSECQQLGIETMTPEELKSLISDWGRSNG